MRIIHVLCLAAFLLCSCLLVGQDQSVFESSDLIEQVKIERNLGFSVGYNPFPQEFLVNLELRASKRFSPFLSMDIGYENLRSEPIENGNTRAGEPIYETPTIVGDKSYYKIGLGYRVTFGERTGNYNGLCLDFGLEAKFGGDELLDYYSLFSRIGYRMFFTQRLYVLTSMKFNMAYSEDKWNPNGSQILLPDFDVDLLNVRVGYQF